MIVHVHSLLKMTLECAQDCNMIIFPLWLMIADIHVVDRRPIVGPIVPVVLMAIAPIQLLLALASRRSRWE